MKQAMASEERDVPGSGRTTAGEATGFSEDQLRAITSVVRSLLNEEFPAGRREERRGDDGRGSSKCCGNSRKRGGAGAAAGPLALRRGAGVGNGKGARQTPRSHATVNFPSR